MPAEFSFNVYITLCFFLVCGGYVYISARTIASDLNSKLHREHLTAVVCVVLPCLFYGLMTITQDETALHFLWGAGYLSYFMFLPLWIRFTSNMYSIKHKITKLILRVGLICISVVFAFAAILSGDVVFVKTSFGNQFSYEGSLIFQIIAIYVFLLSVYVFISHIRWWRESKMERQRVQQQIFLILSFVFAPVGFVTDFVVPAFTSYTFPPIVPLLLFPPAMQLYISMRANRTLSITVRNVSSYIFESVTIPTLVLDHANYVRLENKATIDFFGESIIGKNISKIISLDEKKPKQSFFDIDITSTTVTIETPVGNRICDMLLSVENDKYGDALCKVILLRDITESNRKDNLLLAVNQAASLLLSTKEEETIEGPLMESMELVGQSMEADQVHLWQADTSGEEIRFNHSYI